MTIIQINNLPHAGADLLKDEESFLQDLEVDELPINIIGADDTTTSLSPFETKNISITLQSRLTSTPMFTQSINLHK